jgi:uncharacterized membrane protein
MLSVPKSPFLIVGILEALAAAAGMAAAANLSGPSTTVLSQTFLVWQIFFSIIFLGRRYSVNQILGCTLVALGVIVSVARLDLLLYLSFGIFTTNSQEESPLFFLHL